MKSYFIIAYLVITAITLGACSRRAESTSTAATSTPPPAGVAPIPPSPSTESLAVASTQQAQPNAAAEPPFNAPPGTSLVASGRSRCIHVVDVAPGKPASPSLPAGSVYLGCATVPLSSDYHGEGIPTIIEWDVARGRVLRSVDLPLTAMMHVKTFNDNVYIASIPTEGMSETQLVALDTDLRPRETHSLTFSISVSLEANEKYLAVSYRPHGDKFYPLKIELLDANHLTTVATSSVGSADLILDDIMERPGDALEFFGDQLYVAGVPSFTKPPEVPSAFSNGASHNLPFVRVFAMSLPSLEIVGIYKSKKDSYYPLRLQSAAGHLILTGDQEGYEEFTADLKPIRKHDGWFYAGTAFDPITGEVFSCPKLGEPNLGKPEKYPGTVTNYSAAFWTGLEAACVADVEGHIIVGRLKDWPTR